MKKVLLLAIIFLGFILRIAYIETKPHGVFVDEAALGYSAFSILETGKDEHAVSYPFLFFKSFGDYKPPLYFYSQLPFIKVLGLTNTSVRLPSVIAGTFLILVMYFVLRKLKYNYFSSLFAASIIAFSPWTIYLSRFAFESNLTLLFFSLGLFF